MYPLKFHPVYKEKIWGGDALHRLYGRELPSDRVGESWDVSAHPHGQSVVANGPLAGKQLADLLRETPQEILGRTPFAPNGEFPLLVKLLDCNDWLSVQVHPDDEYASIHENGSLGKTETWLILHAEPGARIVYGVKPGTTKEQFAKALQDGSVEALCQMVTVNPGEVYSVPAGTIHALGAGVVVAEVQQNSDTVYRVYDWGRLGADGKPRELHVEKALEVIDFTRPAPERSTGIGPECDFYGRRGSCKRRILAANEKFIMERLAVHGEWMPEKDDRFYIYMVLSGEMVVSGEGETLHLSAGDSILVPASCSDLLLSGDGVLLRAYVPGSEEEVASLLG